MTKEKITAEEHERRMEFARQYAAQAWTKPTTSAKVMDTDLAEAFAEILVVHLYEHHLGCATTEEILDELKSRLTTEQLKYKTISQ